MKLDAETWYTGLGQVALAFFGGLIGALMRREVSNWQTALLAACGAAFAGFLVAKFCRATGVSEDLTYAFVGVAGWLGAVRTIGYLERLVEPHLARMGIAPRSRSTPAATYGEEKTNGYTGSSGSASTLKGADNEKGGAP